AQLGQQRYRAAISVGSNPTFTPEAPVQVEAYLLDFSGDIYGQTLELEFLHRLRGMEVFADVQALIEQMRLDVLEVRAILPLELLA
ncbi:MAG: riboflavin kinase, partial [Microbacteriaceae bacterium]|nr:riboflavin kinase [Microbacteriaceae bacterium]